MNRSGCWTFELAVHRKSYFFLDISADIIIMCRRVPALCSIFLFPYLNMHSRAGAWEREKLQDMFPAGSKGETCNLPGLNNIIINYL